MFSKRRIVSSDGKWYDWDVIPEEGVSATCPVCSGRLIQRMPDGFIAVPTYPITGGYIIRDRFKKLPEGQWWCLGCQTTFRLKEIARPVLVAGTHSWDFGQVEVIDLSGTSKLDE